MDFLEKNLEDIIIETPNEVLVERGLYIRGLKRRQVKIGNYGIADLITLYRCYEGDPCHDFRHNNKQCENCKTRECEITDKVVVELYELKKGMIDFSAFVQALGYLNGIKNYISNNHFNYTAIDYNIVIIGNSIDLKSSFCYLPNLFENVSLYTYKYKFDGIYFESVHGYKLTEEGF